MSLSVSNAASATRRIERRADGDLLLKFLFTFGLIFLFPAFTVQLAFNPVTQTFTGSTVLKMVNLGCEILALAVVFGSRSARDFVLQCRPILVLVGMAFMWAPFSYNPQGTLQAANVLLTVTLFGLAMVTRFGPRECLRLVIRTMAIGCALSFYWVVVYPLEAVHQATDAFQFQHAGLWRGIFSHKQGLGVFSGLTFGLLLFYGSIVFPSFIVRWAALGCALRCLIGTKSATGELVAIITPLTLYSLYWIARSSLDVRKGVVAFLPAAATAIMLCFLFGVFDAIPQMLGKSSDMTGRADIWPLVIDNFNHSAAAFFGGGFGTGFAATLSDFSVDNGYIDKLIEFGYIGSVVIFATFISIFFSAGSLIITTSKEDAAVNVFPIAVWFVILFINISESNFMYKHLSTVLTAVIVGLITHARLTYAASTGIGATTRVDRSLRHSPAAQDPRALPRGNRFRQRFAASSRQGPQSARRDMNP